MLSDLARFRAMAENAPAHRLIRTLFAQTGIYAAVNEAGRANLRTFYELARSYEASAYRGLYRFLDRVDDMIANGKGLPARDAGEEEAVTVSTIHASKGLEYPVCILAHTGKELKRADTSPFLFSRELGVVCAIPTKNGSALLSTPLITAQTILARKRETEEAVRVLYVALTRPKEQLYLFAGSGRKKTETLLSEVDRLVLSPSVTALDHYSSYAVWMLAAMKRAQEIGTLRRLPPPYLWEETLDTRPSDSKETKTETPVSDEALRAQYRALFAERFAFAYPHAPDTLLPAKLSVSSLYPGVLDELNARSPMDAPTPSASTFDEETDTADFSPIPLFPEEQAASEEFTPTLPAFLSGKEENEAALAGTATHLFLQFCDFSKILTTKGCQNEIIKTELTRLCEQGFLTEKDASRVRIRELAAFLSSDLAHAIEKNTEMYREFRFHAMLDARLFSFDQSGTYDGRSVFVQGVIDLLFRREDGKLLLVDYKTDRLPRGASDKEAADLLFSRHGTQLTIYAHALAKIFGEACDVAIYSLPLGKLLFAPATLFDLSPFAPEK